ncbi:hypothetical protein IGI39_001251 [Enterococcus sp. AZ135]
MLKTRRQKKTRPQKNGRVQNSKHHTFPAPVLTVSGSMGIISASKAPLVSFNY